LTAYIRLLQFNKELIALIREHKLMIETLNIEILQSKILDNDPNALIDVTEKLNELTDNFNALGSNQD
jgi:hypothetical protein